MRCVQTIPNEHQYEQHPPRIVFFRFTKWKLPCPGENDVTLAPMCDTNWWDWFEQRQDASRINYRTELNTLRTNYRDIYLPKENIHTCALSNNVSTDHWYIWFNRNSIQRLFLIWDGRRICSADFHRSGYNHIELTNDVYIEEKRRESTWWFDSSNSTKNAGA